MGYHFSIYPSLLDGKCFEVIGHDKICRSSYCQGSDGQAIMFDRMNASRPEHVKKIIPFRQRPPHQLIDVPDDEVIRVFVVTAKHNQVREFSDEWNECFKILCRTAFSDENFYA